MSDYEENVKQAKKALKMHIKFLESMLKHLNSNNEAHKGAALIGTYHINNYLGKTLMSDMEKAIMSRMPANDPQ